MNSVVSLPTQSGAYRWLYVDVTAGPYTAVAIFMVGSLFSARYSAAARRGGLPVEYSAVNFALYCRGKRLAWVLTEYASAHLGEALRIGSSSWCSENGSARIEIDDRTAPWGRPTRARIEMRAECPSAEPLQLVPGQPHFWQAIAARGWARVEVPTLDLSFEGRAYHDGNHGDELLGEAIAGWRWSRIHSVDSTRVLYEPPGVRPLVLSWSGGRLSVERAELTTLPTARSRWGLRLPTSLEPFAPSEALGPPALLESSPFYARLEAKSHDGQTHSLSEVADFRRFHQRRFRWMAHFRTRRGQ